MRATLTIMSMASASLLSGGVQGANDFPPSYFGQIAIGQNSPLAEKCDVHASPWADPGPERKFHKDADSDVGAGV